MTAALALGACGSPANRGQDVDGLFEDVDQGVVTELREVSPDEWRIADERVVEDSLQSRVIATGLDGVSDTFTLDELRAQGAVAAADTTVADTRHRRRGFFTPILFYGLFGSRFGRSYGRNSGVGPRPGAYVNQSAYNRVQSTAAPRLRTPGSSARPSGGRSGYGAGRSTRSFGG